MTTSISNTTSTTTNPEHKLYARSRGAEQTPRNPSQATVKQETPASVLQSPSGDLERASHLYRTENSVRQERSETVQNPIQDQDEARSLLGRIKAQIAGNPAGAMTAFGRFNGPQTAALLGQTPA